MNMTVVKLAEMINKELFNDEYTWAQLTDDTRRYTEMVSDNKNIVPIKGWKPLKADAGLTRDVNLIGRTYGCCERKMQAANEHDFKSDKLFYARWAPCEKCIPAILLENGKIRIFAIARDYHEWKSQKNRGVNDVLQEYQIRKGLYKVK